MRDQKNILKKSKNFLKEASFNNLDIAYNPNYFLSSWSESIGYLNIKNFFNKKIPIFFKNKIIFKEFFSINKDFLIKEKNLIDFDYTDLVITYFFPENLKKDGTYDDKYFSTNSKSIKKVLWILIPLSKNIKNRKTKKNVIILKRKNNNIFKNLFFTLLMFFQEFCNELWI